MEKAWSLAAGGCVRGGSVPHATTALAAQIIKAGVKLSIAMLTLCSYFLQGCVKRCFCSLEGCDVNSFTMPYACQLIISLSQKRLYTSFGQGF